MKSMGLDTVMKNKISGSRAISRVRKGLLIVSTVIATFAFAEITNYVSLTQSSGRNTEIQINLPLGEQITSVEISWHGGCSWDDEDCPRYLEVGDITYAEMSYSSASFSFECKPRRAVIIPGDPPIGDHVIWLPRYVGPVEFSITVHSADGGFYTEEEDFYCSAFGLELPH